MDTACHVLAVMPPVLAVPSASSSIIADRNDYSLNVDGLDPSVSAGVLEHHTLPGVALIRLGESRGEPKDFEKRE